MGYRENRPAPARFILNAVAQNQGIASSRLEQPCHYAQGGGFPGTVGTQKGTINFTCNVTIY